MSSVESVPTEARSDTGGEAPPLGIARLAQSRSLPTALHVIRGALSNRGKPDTGVDPLRRTTEKRASQSSAQRPVPTVQGTVLPRAAQDVPLHTCAHSSCSARSCWHWATPRSPIPMWKWPWRPRSSTQRTAPLCWR